MTARDVGIDYLRATVTLMVLAHHSSLAYTTFAHISSTDYLNATAPIVDSARWAFLDYAENFNDVFFMSLMFFLSGLFVWPSIRKRGPLPFLRDRLLRLGLPFLVGVTLLMPIAYYASWRSVGGAPGYLQFWSRFLFHDGWPAGPLWFIWLLLFFDALAVLAWSVTSRVQQRVEGYYTPSDASRLANIPTSWKDAQAKPPAPPLDWGEAAWWRRRFRLRLEEQSKPATVRQHPAFARPKGDGTDAPSPHARKLFAILYVLAAVAYIPMLAKFGFGLWRPFLTPPLWFQVPRIFLYLVWFIAGIVVGTAVSNRGLLSPEGSLARRWPWWLAACVVAYNLLWFVPGSAFVQSLHWPRLGVGLLYALLWVLSCTASCFALLALFRGVVKRRRAWMDSLVRCSYILYLIHYVFLTWVQYLLLGIDLPAPLKFALTLTAVVALSWSSALLLLRIPRLSAIL
ncbi:MAG TPA: acyltransferase family protein [Bryobacteraceae bacterium]|nr:acyltransferase family protein [Bryobacteraceae bacterium]